MSALPAAAVAAAVAALPVTAGVVVGVVVVVVVVMVMVVADPRNLRTFTPELFRRSLLDLLSRRDFAPVSGGWSSSAMAGAPDVNHDFTVDHIPGFFAPPSDPTLLMLPCPLSDRKEKLLRCAGLAAGLAAGSVRASSPEGARSRFRLGVVRYDDPGEAEPALGGAWDGGAGDEEHVSCVSVRASKSGCWRDGRADRAKGCRVPSCLDRARTVQPVTLSTSRRD